MSLSPYCYNPQNPALRIQAPTIQTPARTPGFEARFLSELAEIKAAAIPPTPPPSEPRRRFNFNLNLRPAFSFLARLSL